jgi:hypothetical protein
MHTVHDRFAADDELQRFVRHGVPDLHSSAS